MRSLAIAQAEIGKPYDELEEILFTLQDVLIETGDTELIDFIPWIGKTCSPDITQFDRKHIHLYSIAFQLLNKIEERGAIRTRRKMEDEEGLSRINGLWAKNLLTLKEAGISPEGIVDILKNTTIEPVFTAHPTEVKRQTILAHHRQLYLLLVKLENSMYTAFEREEIKADIKLVLERLWLSGEVQLRKPDIAMELSDIVYYLTTIFPDVIINLDRRLYKAWECMKFDPKLIEAPNTLPTLSFGNWIGGDRDGHPLVTAEITRESLMTLRTRAIQLIRTRLSELENQLGFYCYLDQVTAELKSRFIELLQAVPQQDANKLQIMEGEVFRQYVRLLILKLPTGEPERVPNSGSNPPRTYQNSKALIEDLDLLYQALIRFGARSIAQADVKNTIRLVNCFGFHLAHLDIRQNSEFHELALSQLMTAADLAGDSLATWSEAQKLRFLNEELKSLRPFALPDTPLEHEAREVVSCYRVLADFIAHHGNEAIGNLIVSMTRNLSDLLTVYVLAKEAGLVRQTEQGPACLLQVVPLFETIDDLLSSTGILESFLNHPFTKRSLEIQKKLKHASELTQLVMIGYSDSNKDGGILASQWALYQAEQKLQEIGKKTGINVRYFHGRGGTISRGAGPTQWFIKTLPHSTVNGFMRLTEQGETIHQKYANLTNATYNLELLTANTVGVTALHSHFAPRHDPLAETMALLAKISMDHYMELIHHPDFITFFSQATPIDAIEASRIGSRPARRTGKRTLQDLRAIPWVFSWGQARFNLTSWYGVGKALEDLFTTDPDQFERLVKNAREDSLARYILANVDTSLAATDETIMNKYAALVEPSSVRIVIMRLILAELAKTRVMLAKVFITPFQERRLHHHISNQLRAEALEILHAKQLDLLRQWRSSGAEASSHLGMNDTLSNLLLTVNGIASALRNTG